MQTEENDKNVANLSLIDLNEFINYYVIHIGR